MKKQDKAYAALLAAYRAWRKKWWPVLFGKKRKPKPAPLSTIIMYDSVTLSALPKGADAYAGYVNGAWPTFKSLPLAKHQLSIAVNAGADARCLDVEAGDATPDQAAAWIKKQKARGEILPVVYTSAAYVQPLVNKLDASGLRYGKDYQLWSAHYTGIQHFCGPGCGYGIKVRAHATQFKTSTSPNLDTSICSAEFFPAIPL